MEAGAPFQLCRSRARPGSGQSIFWAPGRAVLPAVQRSPVPPQCSFSSSPGTAPRRVWAGNQGSQNDNTSVAQGSFVSIDWRPFQFIVLEAKGQSVNLQGERESQGTRASSAEEGNGRGPGPGIHSGRDSSWAVPPLRGDPRDDSSSLCPVPASVKRGSAGAVSKDLRGLCGHEPDICHRVWYRIRKQ